jgi:hypothetical protein
MGSEAAGVVIDDTGQPLPSHPLYLARRLGCPTGDFDVIAHAVRNLGFIQVTPVRGAVLVKFEPATVSRLAAIAAFYEIAGRAPKRLILACPGKPGAPDRYEIFQDLGEGLRRLEAAFETRQDADGGTGPPPQPRPLPTGRGHPPRPPELLSKDETPPGGGSSGGRAGPGRPSRRGQASGGQVVSLWRPDGLAIRQQAEDFSKRLCLPLTAIAPQDEWLGQLLSIWRQARPRWRLPAGESLDTLEVLNIARGRAHIVETTAPDPSGYRFRIWGAASPFADNYRNQTLAQMPAGLMREDAFEDYWEVVTTGVPSYQLIQHVENGRLFSYARLLLPLATDGRHVDRLLVLFNERPLPELGMP